MKKKHLFQILAALPFLYAGAAFAQQNYVGKYAASQEYKESVQQFYAKNKLTLPAIGAGRAVASIKKMEREGYTFDRDYVTAIQNSAGNPDTVKQLYFYAVIGATPPPSSVPQSQADIDAEIKKLNDGIQKEYGMGLQELERLVGEQENMPQRPLPKFSD